MNTKKTCLIIALAGVGLVVAFFAWAIISGNKDAKIQKQLVEHYLDLSAKGDYENAQLLLTPQFRATLTQDSFFKLMAPVKDGEITGYRDANAVKRIVTADVKVPNGEMHSISFEFAPYPDTNTKIADIAVDGKLKVVLDAEAKAAAEANQKNQVIKEVILGHEDVDFMEPKPASVFRPDDTIFIGVMTTTENGITVTVVLKNIDDGFTSSPVTDKTHGVYAVLGKGSFSGANFYFKPPTKGWPAGEYAIVAASSKGDTKEAAFTVR